MNATLIAFASLLIIGWKKRQPRAPLFNIDDGFLYIILWIFFAFPIEPRRLILLYQKNQLYTTIRLTFFTVYYKILMKNIGNKHK